MKDYHSNVPSIVVVWAKAYSQSKHLGASFFFWRLNEHLFFVIYFDIEQFQKNKINTFQCGCHVMHKKKLWLYYL